jgi:hypothetical protein
MLRVTWCDPAWNRRVQLLNRAAVDRHLVQALPSYPPAFGPRILSLLIALASLRNLIGERTESVLRLAFTAGGSSAKHSLLEAPPSESGRGERLLFMFDNENRAAITSICPAIRST